jgi:hypothetical protein
MPGMALHGEAGQGEAWRRTARQSKGQLMVLGG